MVRLRDTEMLEKGEAVLSIHPEQLSSVGLRYTKLRRAIMHLSNESLKLFVMTYGPCFCSLLPIPIPGHDPGPADC